MAMRAVAVDPTQTFNRAVSAYKAGRLGDAEQLCQQILSAQPGHFDAAHVLAVVQASRGRNDLALASYDRALAMRRRPTCSTIAATDFWRWAALRR